MYNMPMKEYRCIDCIHCDVESKKCHPESEDCRSEYDLTDDDINIHTTERCDYYRNKLIN